MGAENNYNPLKDTNDNYISFRCTYEIKDFEEKQIINYKDKININEEIKLKVKLLKSKKKYDLVFSRRFDKIGLYTFDFAIEGKIRNLSFMFNKCSSLKNIEFISLETSEVTNMDGMFMGCSNLEFIDLSSFDTSKVTSMKYMFDGCFKLKSIKGINNFITTNVTSMVYMFGKCYELEYLDLSNFDVSNVTNISYMFNECKKLKEIKGISFFNTIKVVKMKAMFLECNEIDYLDLSNFNTNNSTDISILFYNCTKLKEIKGVNNFDTTKVMNMSYMFYGCNELEN